MKSTQDGPPSTEVRPTGERQIPGEFAAPILSAKNLTVSFKSKSNRWNKAVDDFNFEINKKEIVAIIGESGSGKSTFARTAMGLYLNRSRSIKIEGEIRFKGADITKFSAKELTRYRGFDVGMVFQDATRALDPTMTIGSQIREAIMVHGKTSKKVAHERVLSSLNEAGMPNPSYRFDQYPHELSGGLRQRAMIAMAISSNPDLIIADEPTSSLDTMTQQKVLKLFGRLRETLGVAIVLITHDMAIAELYSDRITVMYDGKVLEEGPSRELVHAPKVPYTLTLINSIPRLAEPSHTRLPVARESISKGVVALSRCPYSARCAFADEKCRSEQPSFDADLRRGEHHRWACWHPLPVTR